jgi:hypothetical protein
MKKSFSRTEALFHFGYTLKDQGFTSKVGFGVALPYPI